MSRETFFLSELRNLENNINILEVKFKNIQFINIDKMKVFNKIYSISDSAYLSINNQIKVKGIGFQELPYKLVVEIYNTVLNGERLKEKKANIILKDNEVKAVTVGGTDKRAFKYTRTTSIIEVLKEKLQEQDYSFEFLDGVSDDYTTIIRYKIPELFNYKYDAAINIITSYSCYSSIKIIPILFNYKKNIEIKLKEFKIENKGFPLSRIAIEFPNVLEELKKALKNTNDIDQIKIKDNLEEICERIDIPKKLQNFILKNFEGENIRELIDFIDEIDFKDKEKIMGKIISII